MKRTAETGLTFPDIPESWGDESRRFALGLRDLFEQIRWQRAYPIGIVVMSVRKNESNNPVKPFTFGEWEQITTGISGVYGWKRVK